MEEGLKLYLFQKIYLKKILNHILWALCDCLRK